MCRRHDSNRKCQDWWLCQNDNCKNIISISDNDLIYGITQCLNTVISNSDAIEMITDIDKDPSLDVRRFENEISRVLDSHSFDKNILRKRIWKDRPSIPDSPAFVYDIEYAGKSCEEKVAAIRAELTKKGAYALFLSALDEIAWTLNLRGNDVHCNPVVVSYLLITQDDVIYFISPEKVTKEVNEYLKEQHVKAQ